MGNKKTYFSSGIHIIYLAVAVLLPVFIFIPTIHSDISNDKYEHIWYIFMFGWYLLVIIFESFHWYARRFAPKQFRAFLSLSVDLRIIGLFFVLTCFVSVIFFQIGIFSTPGSASSTNGHSGFWNAHIEFFLLGTFFIAIVGAFYAVFAKKVADDVFEKSEEIHNNLTSFFGDYKEVFNQDNKHSLVKLISDADKSLTLFLGSPLVGYFRDQSLGIKFYTALLGKINDNQTHPTFKVKMICWDEERCNQYLNYQNINNDDFMNYRNTLFGLINSLGKMPGTQKPRGLLLEYPDEIPDSVFRFVIADDRRAIFWLLENPTEAGAREERMTKDLKGGGFTVDTSSMINILNNIFQNTYESYNNIRKKINQSPNQSNDVKRS